MPRPYSYDLRIRVMTAVEKGMEVRDASQTFGVHRDTITAWVARKIPDLQQFKTFVATQGDATVEELAVAWGGVGRMTIWRQLRKLGYTQKKRPSGMPSGTKR